MASSRTQANGTFSRKALLLPRPHTVDSFTQPVLILSCSPKFSLCCLSWVQSDLEQQKQHLLPIK